MIHTLVRDWMTNEPLIVKPDISITEAYQLMIENQIRRLPVIDKDKLVGMVTLSDLYKVKPFDTVSISLLEITQQVSNMTVDEVMAPEPITVMDDMTVGEAVQLMLEYRISGLPVIDRAESLVGIITESDIFRIVIQEWTTRKHGSLHIVRRGNRNRKASNMSSAILSRTLKINSTMRVPHIQMVWTFDSLLGVCENYQSGG